MREFGLGEEDLAVWQASGLPDAAFVDWLTDRVAWRPTGARAREVYGAEDVHDFASDEELAALARDAGFRDVAVKSGGGGQLLTGVA